MLCLHGATAGVGEVPDDEKEEQVDEKLSTTEKLIKSVLEDAYAKESMAILEDLAVQQAAVASKKRE